MVKFDKINHYAFALLNCFFSGPVEDIFTILSGIKLFFKENNLFRRPNNAITYNMYWQMLGKGGFLRRKHSCVPVILHDAGALPSF
jgi:hypothetical protein